MKTKNKISGYILRGSAAALLLSCAVVAVCSAINLPNYPPKLPAPKDNTTSGMSGHEGTSSVAAPAIQRNRTLMFADRVAYQRAIEEVYWRHRTWPKENADPKPPLDKVMSQAQIEKKVEDYLRNSQALEDYWQRPITPDQLQAEMDRIASNTKQSGVLREIFAALDNDPLMIAECLARSVLAERLLSELYAHDQRFHGELKRRAEAELRTHHSVKQMKQTSGMYTEMELVRSDSDHDKQTGGSAPNAFGDDGTANRQSGGAERSLRLNSSEWGENVQELAAAFNKPDGAKASAFGVRSRQRGIAAFESADMSAHSKKPFGEYESLPVGKVSSLQEDYAHYYVTAVLNKGKDRLKLATIAWLKEPLRSWLAKAEAQAPVTMAAVTANYTLPVIASPSVACTDDTWTPTSTTNAPARRENHTAVWTGSEMIVWGGFGASGPWLRTGGRYNPSTDSWTATSTINAPAAREVHTAVWTGSYMVVWGGFFFDGTEHYLNTGGRYNPNTDSWTATSTTGAPAGRYAQTAVWTGSEMIVWGGSFFDNTEHYLNTGGRYNPNTNSWTAMSNATAPSARVGHAAVWIGSEMIVWGGYFFDSTGHYLNTGGRYNPSTDSWAPTSTTNVPAARDSHDAIWTGSQMIIWGGYNNGTFLNTGGRYNPITDSWAATSTSNVPAARTGHRAVWTGSEMIVWGGLHSNTTFLNTGGRYHPNTDSWTATSTTDTPPARGGHTAVWTGSQMIIWGGTPDDDITYLNTGGRYCAATLGGGTPPPAPIAEPATNIGSDSFTANWSSVSGATGYRLDLSPNGSFSTYVAGYQDLNVGNTSSRSVTGLSPSTDVLLPRTRIEWCRDQR